MEHLVILSEMCTKTQDISTEETYFTESQKMSVKSTGILQRLSFIPSLLLTKVCLLIRYLSCSNSLSIKVEWSHPSLKNYQWNRDQWRICGTEMKKTIKNKQELKKATSRKNENSSGPINHSRTNLQVYFKNIFGSVFCTLAVAQCNTEL